MSPPHCLIASARRSVNYAHSGQVALLIQIVYVSAVLGPVVAERRRSNRDIADTNHDDGDVMDLFN